MREIKLTKNQVAIVDDEDFDRLSQRAWYFRAGFAMRSIRVPKKDGGGIDHVRMHREILGVGSKTNVIHIDGNRLNNQKANLRVPRWEPTPEMKAILAEQSE